jgi:hypothetical protein
MIAQTLPSTTPGRRRKKTHIIIFLRIDLPLINLLAHGINLPKQPLRVRETPSSNVDNEKYTGLKIGAGSIPASLSPPHENENDNDDVVYLSSFPRPTTNTNTNTPTDPDPDPDNSYIQDLKQIISLLASLPRSNRHYYFDGVDGKERKEIYEAVDLIIYYIDVDPLRIFGPPEWTEGQPQPQPQPQTTIEYLEGRWALLGEVLAELDNFEEYIYGGEFVVRGRKVRYIRESTVADFVMYYYVRRAAAAVGLEKIRWGCPKVFAICVAVERLLFETSPGPGFDRLFLGDEEGR